MSLIVVLRILTANVDESMYGMECPYVSAGIEACMCVGSRSACGRCAFLTKNKFEGLYIGPEEYHVSRYLSGDS